MRFTKIDPYKYRPQDLLIERSQIDTTWAVLHAPVGKVAKVLAVCDDQQHAVQERNRLLQLRTV